MIAPDLIVRIILQWNTMIGQFLCKCPSVMFDAQIWSAILFVAGGISGSIGSEIIRSWHRAHEVRKAQEAVRFGLSLCTNVLGFGAIVAASEKRTHQRIGVPAQVGAGPLAGGGGAIPPLQ